MTLEEALRNDLESFTFEQSVRLMDVLASTERSLDSLRFNIDSFLARHLDAQTHTESDLEIDVIQLPIEATGSITFRAFGLAGSNSPLPRSYLDDLLAAASQGETGPAAFVGILQDRLVKLYYLAWRRSQIALRYETAQHSGILRSAGARPVDSILGLGRRSLMAHAASATGAFSQDRLRYFSGIISSDMRSAAELERILCSVLGMPVSVTQFWGSWLRLNEDQVARLDGRRLHHKALGQRAWSASSTVKVRLKDVPWKRFTAFLPFARPQLEAGVHPLFELMQFLEFYLGPTVEADVEIIPSPDDVRPAQLHGGFNLGENSYLGKPRPDDARGPRFRTSNIRQVNGVRA